MNNIMYKIFHIDHMSNRSACVERNKILFQQAGIEELDCMTQDFSTFKIMDEFINSSSGFEVRRHNEYTNPFPHVSGVIGIWASNWLAWKEFLNNDAEYLIIMEDDISLNDDSIPTLNKILPLLPEDWDVFSFFMPPSCEVFYSEYIHMIDNQIVCKPYQGWSCGGYIINRNGAKKIIEYLEENPIDSPIDFFMFSQTPDMLNVYNPLPFLKRIAEFDNDYINSYIGDTEGAH